MTTPGASGQTRQERLVPLAGAMNFRDLGGYRAADGQAVRWGRVYRSDGLDQLTNADVEVLAERGLRLVCVEAYLIEAGGLTDTQVAEARRALLEPQPDSRAGRP